MREGIVEVSSLASSVSLSRDEERKKHHRSPIRSKPRGWFEIALGRDQRPIRLVPRGRGGIIKSRAPRTPRALGISLKRFNAPGSAD